MWTLGSTPAESFSGIQSREILRVGEERVARTLVLGWLGLAVAALLVAGAFAVLVAVARTPVVQRVVGEGYFRVSLVAHVTFSLNVWLLSFAGALWALVPARWGIPPRRNMGLASLWLAGAGAALMAGSSFAGLGRPLLIDYIPVLEHPLFAAGLGAFLAGVGLGALAFLLTLRHFPGPLPLETKALRLGAVTCLMALLTLAVGWSAGWGGDWAALAWGSGHLFQVVNATSMVAVWLLLLRKDLPLAQQALLRGALPFFLMPAVLVPLLYLLPGPLLMGTVGALTWAGLAVPTVAAWLLVGHAVLRDHPRGPGLVPLLVSLLLFTAGVLAAVLGLEGDTRVTAHYHGTVGAVTVACMGFTYRLLPLLGIRLRLPGWARLQPALYGGGLLLLIAGLFWAASLGGQRKAFEAFAQQSSIFGPMSLFLLGALLAVVGGVAYVLVTGASLLGKQRMIAASAVRPPAASPLAEVSIAPGAR